jgi:hypothetical protein
MARQWERRPLGAQRSLAVLSAFLNTSRGGQTIVDTCPQIRNRENFRRRNWIFESSRTVEAQMPIRGFEGVGGTAPHE